jgi:hypothetical protein
VFQSDASVLHCVPVVMQSVASELQNDVGRFTENRSREPKTTIRRILKIPMNFFALFGLKMNKSL